MRLRCIICHANDELKTDERLIGLQMLKFIPEPKNTDLLRIAGMMKGKTCNGKEHKFTFHEEFDKDMLSIMQDRKIGKDSEADANALKSEIVEIGVKIKELSTIRLEKIDQRNRLMDSSELKLKSAGDKLEKLTGSSDFKLWQ